MKKVVIKEFDKTHLIIDIMLYTIFVVVGFILLNFSEIELLNPVRYASPLFFMFGFFSLLAYFMNRREGDYELLIFGFINVCIAAFILVYISFPNSAFIMADAVLVYSIANVINKGYHCKQLLKNRDVNFFTKLSVTILLLFLGVFVVSSLYTKIEVGSMILGYYFIIFGLLSLLEPLISILTRNVRIEKYILEFLAYEDNKEEEKEVVKEEPKKELKTRKPPHTQKISSIKKKPIQAKKINNTPIKTPKKRSNNKKTNKK